MGTHRMMTCGCCGTHGEFTTGSGTMLEELFHCDSCGEEKWVERNEFQIPLLSESESRCSCGGTFTTKAPPRCSTCYSTYLIEYQGTEPQVITYF